MYFNLTMRILNVNMYIVFVFDQAYSRTLQSSHLASVTRPPLLSDHFLSVTWVASLEEFYCIYIWNFLIQHI